MQILWPTIRSCIGDFILESREHLTAIELQLLTLDQDPANAEAIHAIFRGFHTIKGMAGFLDLDAVRDLAHEVETVLDLARNDEAGDYVGDHRPDTREQGLSQRLDGGAGRDAAERQDARAAGRGQAA